MKEIGLRHPLAALELHIRISGLALCIETGLLFCSRVYPLLYLIFAFLLAFDQTLDSFPCGAGKCNEVKTGRASFKGILR